MSCDITHAQLIDYLYDDNIRPDERDRLKSELETQRQQDFLRVDRGLQVIYNTQENRYDNLLRQLPLERLPVNLPTDQPTRFIPASGQNR